MITKCDNNDITFKVEVDWPKWIGALMDYYEMREYYGL